MIDSRWYTVLRDTDQAVCVMNLTLSRFPLLVVEAGGGNERKAVEIGTIVITELNANPRVIGLCREILGV